MFTIAHAAETDGVSHLASLIFSRLYDDDGTEAKIYGPVIICDEWDDERVDFELTGYTYNMSAMQRNT